PADPGRAASGAVQAPGAAGPERLSAPPRRILTAPRPKSSAIARQLIGCGRRAADRLSRGGRIESDRRLIGVSATVGRARGAGGVPRARTVSDPAWREPG